MKHIKNNNQHRWFQSIIVFSCLHLESFMLFDFLSMRSVNKVPFFISWLRWCLKVLMHLMQGCNLLPALVLMTLTLHYFVVMHIL